MNLITVDITNLRNKLSDYLALVGLGKAIISVKNAKSGKEVARIIMPPVGETTDDLINKRIEELKKIAGFARGYSDKNRKMFRKMDRDYVKKLRNGIVE